VPFAARALYSIMLLASIESFAGCAQSVSDHVGAQPLHYGPLADGQHLRRRIERAMRDHAIPGSSLAIVYGGTTYVRGFGIARIGGDDVSSDTLFRVGSLTKSFTAAAIVELQRAGRVTLDAPVGRYIPGYRYGRAVTVRQLLDQTSGIPNYLSDSRVRSALVSGRTVDPVSLVESYRPAFKPGSRWEYSNSNYLLLASIIASASRTTYTAYVREHVLAACRLGSTRLPGEPLPANTARGYTLVRGHLAEQPALPSSLLGGAAGISSDASDLAKWGDCFASVILAPVTSAALRTDARQRYVLGWFRTKLDDTTVFWHNGFEPGFAAAMTMVPSRRLAVVALFNSDTYDPAALAMTITGDLLATSQLAVHARRAL
jgi:CubicO group peptidase (beta-lactamase class C family)